MDRRPDARPRLCARGWATRLLVERQRLADAGHVLDRDDDREIERLPRARIDDGNLAPRPDPAEESRDRVERPLCRRQPDPLERRGVVGTQVLESFEAQREGCTPLRAGDWMDLVDD